MEAEYLPFDKALLASDDFCGHCTPDRTRQAAALQLASDDFGCHSAPDKAFERGILAGLSHGPRRAQCRDYAPVWPYAVAGAQRDGYLCATGAR